MKSSFQAYAGGIPMDTWKHYCPEEWLANL